MRPDEGSCFAPVSDTLVSEGCTDPDQLLMICRVFKPILTHCYTSDAKLVFELKNSEAAAMCRAFDKAAAAAVPKAPRASAAAAPFTDPDVSFATAPLSMSNQAPSWPLLVLRPPGATLIANPLHACTHMLFSGWYIMHAMHPSLSTVQLCGSCTPHRLDVSYCRPPHLVPVNLRLTSGSPAGWLVI